MVTHNVEQFKPSIHGWHFENDFANAPVIKIPVPPFGQIPIGNAAGGLCGGMVFSVMDYFYQKKDIPIDKEPPQPNTPLFNYIAKRLIDSFNGVFGILKYLEMMALGEAGQQHYWIESAADHSINEEWPKIKNELDKDKLCPLGIVEIHSFNPMKLSENHQILAYGYFEDNDDLVSLKVYDPNFPDNDTLLLTFDISGKRCKRILYEEGTTIHGFFKNDYCSLI